MPDVPDGIILFDGVCVLCSGWVRSIVTRDPDAIFRFVPIQSPYGQTLARRLGIDTQHPETSAVVMGGLAYFKFDAAILVWRRLGWTWAASFRFLPRAVRDWLYDRLMKNRYRLFGRTEACMVPTPDNARRFIHDEPAGR